MGRIGAGLSIITMLASGAPAMAQQRPYTRALTCSAVKEIVAREQNVVLSTSSNAYEMVHRDVMACASDETGAPAFEPTSDDANCLAGWRCKQRNSDSQSK